MYNFKFTGSTVGLFCLILFQLLILPSGCSTAPKPAGSEAGSPSLPIYELGTTYVYSDGSWETVAGISPPLITWQDHRGNVYSRSPDFTYRSVNWKTSKRQGSRRIVPRSDILIRKNISLWPLQKGNVSSFTEMVTSNTVGEPEKFYRRNWNCEVVGTERISVVAGKFDTWKIACKRYNNYKKPSKAKIREIRTWNYAPEIKHYVLTEKQYFTGKPVRRLELLAILPPFDGLSDSASRQVQKAFQMALEYKKRGETAAWSIPNTSWSGQITPTGSFRLADGRYSRRYIQKVNNPKGQRIYYGLAVRDTNGVWAIPRR